MRPQQSCHCFLWKLNPWRKTACGDKRKQACIDFALHITGIFDIRYPKTKKVVLILDNLNTHGICSFMRRFLPQKKDSGL